MTTATYCSQTEVVPLQESSLVDYTHCTCDVLVWVVFVAVIHEDQRTPVVPVADAPVTAEFKG